jgi:hypothetical protein
MLAPVKLSPLSPLGRIIHDGKLPVRKPSLIVCSSSVNRNLDPVLQLWMQDVHSHLASRKGYGVVTRNEQPSAGPVELNFASEFPPNATVLSLIGRCSIVSIVHRSLIFGARGVLYLQECFEWGPDLGFLFISTKAVDTVVVKGTGTA